MRYDPETGVLSRRKMSLKVNAGSVKHGYRCVIIDRKSYQVHRLAWLYMTGEFPAQEIDHINHDRLDNRFRNLRQASRAENTRNRKGRAKSGLKGAYGGRNDRWHSKIGGRYLGMFDSAEEAHAAFMNEARKLYGEFASA